MQHAPMDWMPGSPRLNPAWRYHLAHWWLSNQVNHSDPYDDWLSRCEAFLAAHHTDDKAAADTIEVDHAIERARRIWQGDKVLRSRLEAFLLSGEPLDAVAQRCYLPTAAVEAFAALFFDVVERRHCRDWIVNYVIGPLPSDPHDEADWLAKTIAYHGGPLILATYLAVVNDEPLVVPAELSDTEAAAWVAEQKFCCKLLVAQLSARSPADANAVARIATKFCNIKKPAHLKKPRLEPIEEVMVGFLRMVNRSGRKPGSKKRTRRPSASARAAATKPALVPHTIDFE